MEGFVKIHRNITEWRWYRNSAMVHLLVHLIVRANFCDREWKSYTIRRGQLATTRAALSQETGLSEKTVRTSLRRLAATGEIKVETTNRCTLITVSKYNDYQGCTGHCGQQEANKGPADGQQVATTEEIKNRKEEESSLRSDSLSMTASTGTDGAVIDGQAFLRFFNQEMAGCQIPPIRQIDRQRQGMLNARAREYGTDALAVVVRKAAASSFLNCGTGQFTASFDWMFRPANFRKILEGNYDNRHNVQERIAYGEHHKTNRTSADVYQGAELVVDAFLRGECPTPPTPPELPAVRAGRDA